MIPMKMAAPRPGTFRPQGQYPWINGLFSIVQPSTRGIRRWQFRRFAEFRGLTPGRWPHALHCLTLCSAKEAVRRIDEFRQWLTRSGFSVDTANCAVKSLRRFARFAHDCGRVRWSLLTQSQKRIARAWNATTPSFRKLLCSWLDSLSISNYTPSTIGGYRRAALLFGNHLARHGTELPDLTPDILSSWIALGRQQGLCASTIRSRFTSARSFYTWLRKRGIVSRDPFHDTPRIRVIPPIPHHFSEAEMLQLIHHARTTRERAIIEVLYASGCRVGEATAIDLRQTCLRTRTIRCIGKARKERILFLNRPAVRAIRAYLPERAEILRKKRITDQTALFIGNQGKHFAPSYLGCIVTRVIRRAALQGSGHIIRHSFATHLLNRGATFASVMALLGHKTPRITSQYAQLLPDYIRRAYRKAKPRR